MSARWNLIGLGAMAVIGLALLFGLPQVVGLFVLLKITVFAVLALLALSLGLVWGYGGILCFGQAAFFGLGAYTYAVAAFNMPETWPAVLIAIALPAAFAALLGYVMFYGRLTDVYMGVVTLVVTLILFKFISHTAGSEYKIGTAFLGGFNGIPAIPPINWPGDPRAFFGPQEMFTLSVAALFAIYFALRALLASHFGRTIVAIRENERRAELLGYDVRLHKLVVFAIGGAIAGLAGCLFANWNAFISPDAFSLATTAKIIIWVIVGGLGTLVGPMIGAAVLEYITSLLGAGAQQVVNLNLVLGSILVFFVLVVPQGVVPVAAQAWRRLRRGRRG